MVEAAAAGDTEATAILIDAGRELALLVDSARRRLGFSPDETVLVSYSGGVFRSPRVLDAFTGALKSSAAEYELRQPLFEPVVGAAIYAAKLAGTPLGTEALATLRSSSDITTTEDSHDDA